MKKLVFRVISYVLDLALVTVFIYGLSMIDVFNPNNDKLDFEYNSYYSSVGRYSELEKNIDKYLEDSMISADERSEICIKYNDYCDVLDNYNIGVDLKEKEISELKTDIDRKYNTVVNDYAYKINKLNLPQMIISLVVYVLYFGVLQYFLKGQTVFKRIFRIKVVNKDDKKKRVSLFSFIIRALLVSEILISLFDLALAFSISKTAYFASSYWVGQFKYVYEMAFLVCMIIRDDQKSLDDLLLRTRVIRFDKHGKEIEEKIFNDIEEDKKSK